MESNEVVNFNGELVVLVDGIPVFSPMAKMISDFKVLITRDKGGVIKGDADGRKKLLSTMELAYVWFIADRKSPIKNNYEINDRPKKAREKVGLPDTWKPDGHVQIAIDTWEEMTETQTSKVLEEMRDALFSAQKIVSVIRKGLEKKITLMNQMDDSLPYDEDSGVNYQDALMKDIKNIQDMAKTLPEMITTIERLEEKVSKEKSDGKGKGGKTVNRFQFPKAKR